MIKIILDEIKKVKSRSQVSKIVKDNLNSSENNEISEPQVAPDVDKVEFSSRYKNLIINCYVMMIIMILSVARLYFEDNFINSICCMLVFLIGFVFYVKLLFRAWCARMIYHNWNDRFTEKEFLLMDFFDHAMIDPKCFLPVNIKTK